MSLKGEERSVKDMEKASRWKQAEDAVGQPQAKDTKACQELSRARKRQGRLTFEHTDFKLFASGALRE